MNIRFEVATIGILLKGPQENTEELIQRSWSRIG
jgi:hypothetical protein